MGPCKGFVVALSLHITIMMKSLLASRLNIIYTCTPGPVYYVLFIVLQEQKEVKARIINNGKFTIIILLSGYYLCFICTVQHLTHYPTDKKYKSTFKMKS